MKRPTVAGCLAGVACGLAPACDGGSGPDVRAPETRTAGVVLADWTPSGYLAPGCDAALDEIAATGANAVAVVVTWYQPTASASALFSRSDRTPSDAALHAAVLGAQRRGLSVMLKPHVDCEDGTWRAMIRPDSPGEWFAAYRALLLPLAASAESWGVDRLAVGTELRGTLGEKDAWRALIADVRSTFRGEILYAASWDEANSVPFWDAVDLVGVNAYFPVAVRDDPTRVDLLVGWQLWLERLDMLRRRTAKPIVFPEIGYRSVDGAGRAPFRFGDGGREDAGEQADLYWAALEATRHEPWFAGAYWWDWRVDGSGGPGNRDYTPAGKPAADILASFWGS